MSENSRIKLTIAFSDPELDSEELEAQAQNLLAQMRNWDEMEPFDRVLDPNPRSTAVSSGKKLPATKCSNDFKRFSNTIRSASKTIFLTVYKANYGGSIYCLRKPLEIGRAHV